MVEYDFDDVMNVRVKPHFALFVHKLREISVQFRETGLVLPRLVLLRLTTVRQTAPRFERASAASSGASPTDIEPSFRGLPLYSQKSLFDILNVFTAPPPSDETPTSPFPRIAVFGMRSLTLPEDPELSILRNSAI